MNDASEYAFPLQLFIERISQNLKTSSSEHTEGLTRLRELTEKELERDAYIVSFSDKRDDLNQWRAYSKPGQGVCVGFKTDALLAVAASHAPEAIAKVTYIGHDYGPYFDPVIQQATKQFPELHKVGLDGPKLAKILFDSRAVFFKNDAFSDESEWRLHLTQGEDRAGNVQRFRVGASTLIPYREINIRQFHKDYLAEVIVGPSPNLQLSIIALKDFLKCEGHESVIVDGSKVPFRQW